MSEDPDRRSIGFDRAAEYYDRTRALTEEQARATTELLVGEFRGRGRALEVGVGTGLIGLPLKAAGISLAGIDLSPSMLAKLVQKAGGRPPFPVALADAIRVPFRDHAFGGAFFRHVLHLVTAWRAAVAEMIRVVAPGGVVLANLGSPEGPWEEIQRRFSEEAGVSSHPIGLDWRAWADLDDAFARLGATVRELPGISARSDEPLGRWVDGLRDNVYSWTWSVPDEVRVRAAEATKGWAERRFGPLDHPFPFDAEIVWRAYDLPG